MLLISCGAAVYAIGNFVYVHELLMQTYQHADWVNTSWIVAFLAFGLAAHLRRLPAALPADLHEAETSRRTRQLEATIPALLIILIVVVGASLADQITPRVLVSAAALLLIFAFILGAREAWIQAEAQRLTRELRTTNELLLGTNRELQASEARVRDLNVHLEERVADRTRQLQSAYEELEGFAYAVAHDLRAPLRTIDGFSHLLEDAMRPHADAQSSGYLARMRRGALKMAALIDDLLAYSRNERRTLSSQSISLDALVASIVAECSTEMQVRDVRLDLDVPPIDMNVDVEALTLVVRNLFHNALKFTRRAQPTRISIVARLDGDRVKLRIVDNGIGFDMQYHEQIFKLFHRLHRDDEYQGTGIGLALVRKALERMNGRVHAVSKPGEGATFAIELPRSI
jgi:signal transduction histidine kinase